MARVSREKRFIRDPRHRVKTPILLDEPVISITAVSLTEEDRKQGYSWTISCEVPGSIAPDVSDEASARERWMEQWIAMGGVPKDQVFEHSVWSVITRDSDKHKK